MSKPTLTIACLAAVLLMYRFSDAGNDEARYELRGRRRKREDVRGLYSLNHIVKQEVHDESWPWFIRNSDLAAIQGRSRHLPKRREDLGYDYKS